MMNSAQMFNSQMNEVMKRLLTDIRSILRNPSSFDNLPARLAFINQTIPDLLKALDDSGYKSAYESQLRQISKDLSNIHKANKIPLSFTTTDKSVLAALKTVDLNRFNDLGTQAIAGLHQELKNLVLAGVSDKEYYKLIS